MRQIRLSPLHAGRLAAGYPHVLREWLGGRDPRSRPGELAEIVDSRGHFLATAFAEADETIAYRIVSRQSGEPFDTARIARSIRSAAALRRAFIDPESTDAYRVVHGEADGLPGLGVDVYGDYLSLQLYSAGLREHMRAVLEALRETLSPRGVFLTDRSSGPQASRSESAAGKRIWGESPPDGFTVREGGATFLVDLAGGYNTGLFLDNRENRLAIRSHARERQVLNLFCYTASISVHAALGGAARVTSVDISDRILKWGKRNFELNGLDAEAHPFVKADAIEYLRKGSHRGSLYDLIVLDPPSFSTSKKNVFSTARDYASLVSLALEVLSPGGTLVAVSNYRKTPPERFLSDIADISRRQGRPLKLLDYRGAGPDFPVDLAYREAEYLKLAMLAG